MRLAVHVRRLPEPDDLKLLEERLGDAVSLTYGEEAPQGVPFEVLVAGRPSEELLQASDRLRALIVPFAGFPQETRELLLRFPELAVYNLHHNAPATAELALALLLAACKRIVPVDRALRAHDWRPRYGNDFVQLAGKTALVLGLGAIGRRVARGCRALGMKVVAVRRRGPWEDADADAVHPPDALARLLPRANAVVVCLPATPETEGVIGAAELALLPEHALLVNVARGPIVAERPLFEALESGRLFGAGLDVWYQYPKKREESENVQPAELPFHELANVVMSPHRGGHVQETEPLRMAGLAELLQVLSRGEQPGNRVDVQAGY